MFKFVNDLLCSDTWRCERLQDRQNFVRPCARSGHTAVSYGHLVYVFGGQSISTDNNPDMLGVFYNDTWRFDIGMMETHSIEHVVQSQE